MKRTITIVVQPRISISKDKKKYYAEVQIEGHNISTKSTVSAERAIISLEKKVKEILAEHNDYEKREGSIITWGPVRTFWEGKINE